jgi:hypothetical protein
MSKKIGANVRCLEMVPAVYEKPGKDGMPELLLKVVRELLGRRRILRHGRFYAKRKLTWSTIDRQIEIIF